MAKSLKVFIEDILVLAHVGPANPRIKNPRLQTHLDLILPHARHYLLAALSLSAAFGIVLSVSAQSPGKLGSVTLHPALFLVGDSIMKTGTGNGEAGQWGWGSELSSFFDTNKLHIYNEGHGGRSSRSFVEEGLWTNVLERMRPGDFLLIQFGHNDSANSRNYPDRVSLSGSGEQQLETNSPATGKTEVLHTYGWYLRQYVKDAKGRGALPIICSPVPRNTWSGGKMKRGFDGYAQWAAESARASDALFLDLNAIAAGHYDEIGEEKAASYFADRQHTTKAGAQLNAKCVIEGLKGLKNCPLSKLLSDQSKAQEHGN